MIFSFGGYKIDVDVAATRAFYQSEYARTLGQSCGCDICKNYDDAILKAGEKVLSFLKELGIDPQKPGEVFGLDVDGKPEKNGTYFYGGWYHLVGTLLEDKSEGICYDPDPDFDFSLWVTDDPMKMGFIKEGFPEPILEFSIITHLPWLL